MIDCMLCSTIHSESEKLSLDLTKESKASKHEHTARKSPVSSGVHSRSTSCKLHVPLASALSLFAVLSLCIALPVPLSVYPCKLVPVCKCIVMFVCLPQVMRSKRSSKTPPPSSHKRPHAPGSLVVVVVVDALTLFSVAIICYGCLILLCAFQVPRISLWKVP